MSKELVMHYESWIRLWSFRALLEVTEREVNHRSMTQALMMIASVKEVASGKTDTARGDIRWKDVSSVERAVRVDFVHISAV